ncbi:MAG: hypothetical protein ACRDMZ_24325, partial [Solirubrobacteraceae bacterium]
TLARAVAGRAPHVAGALGAAVVTPTRPTLARGKQLKKKGAATALPAKKKKSKSKFRHRRFDPGDRPNFDKATYRHATMGHNLFRDAAFDPNDPKLSLRNLAVPHRFSWKNIRDSTVLYLNHDEDETDFRRWTDRMLVAGYNDKSAQYADMKQAIKSELAALKKAGYGDWDQEVLDVDTRIFWVRSLDRHLDHTNGRCTTARDALVTEVEDYYAATGAYRRSRRRHRHAVADEAGATTKADRQRFAADVAHEHKAMRARAKSARHARGRVEVATTEFSKAINNLFANVSDLGPHDGVNNPVRDRLHLNVSDTGEMSPFSLRMLEMTPDRVSGVAVNSGQQLVGTSGVLVDQDDLEDDVHEMVTEIGPSVANIQNIPFVFQ